MAVCSVSDNVIDTPAADISASQYSRTSVNINHSVQLGCLIVDNGTLSTPVLTCNCIGLVDGNRLGQSGCWACLAWLTHA